VSEDLRYSVNADQYNFSAMPMKRRKRRQRALVPFWKGAEREKHVTALGQEHARLENVFKSKMKRVFGSQERAVVKRLREVM